MIIYLPDAINVKGRIYNVKKIVSNNNAYFEKTEKCREEIILLK